MDFSQSVIRSGYEIVGTLMGRGVERILIAAGESERERYAPPGVERQPGRLLKNSFVNS
jgi:hypothetical protein